MREDKHVILLRTAIPTEGEDVVPHRHHITFTIPSRKECIVKRRALERLDAPLFSIDTDFNRWHLAYMLTGEDPDKAASDSSPQSASIGLHSHGRKHAYQGFAPFPDIDAITINDDTYTIREIREALARK